MTGTASCEASNWPAWAWRCLVVLVSPMVAYILATSIGPLVHGGRALGPAGMSGAMFTAFGALTVAGFGVLLLARGRHNRTAALLGICLLTMSMVITQSTGSIDLVVSWLATRFGEIAARSILQSIQFISTVTIAFGWPLFVLGISGGLASPRQARLIYAAATMCVLVYRLPDVFALWSGFFASGQVLALSKMIGVFGNQLLGYWILLGNYRRADAAGRNRLRIVFSAFVCFLLAALADAGSRQAAWWPPTWNIYLVPGFSLAAAMLLAYAVLRRQLFDFNFVLNRTLVYGALSFVLLAVFGLAEWGVDRLHLIPEEWHQGGPLASAAIALALFLSFHQLRDRIEHTIEKWLFSSWHRNEETLKRFVASAGHFDRSTALSKAFARELRRFAHGAEAALYARQAGGAYRLRVGRLAGARRDLAPDDPLFALLRAEREPLRPSRAQSLLPGALALPMFDQGLLAGFVLLSAKPDGTDYRPDEVQVLGWAVEQVGLALQSLHAHELEAELGRLATGNRALAAERDRLAEERDRLAGERDRLTALLERLAPRAVA